MIWNWFWFAIPEKYIRRYVIYLALILFIIPYWVFGFYYTRLGIIVNLIWFDIIFYGWVKVREQLERDLD
jgi:hypothetical protein